MVSTILNLIAFIIAVAMVVLVVALIAKNDKRGNACNFDCENCPFPKCSEAEIRRMKNDIHNR